MRISPAGHGEDPRDPRQSPDYREKSFVQVIASRSGGAALSYPSECPKIDFPAQPAHSLPMRKCCLFIFCLLLVLTASPAFTAKESSPPLKEGKLRIIELKGTPYERGRTHGQTLKLEIQELVKRWKANLEETYSVPAATYIQRLLEATDFRPAIERWTPGLLDEVRGHRRRRRGRFPNHVRLPAH